MCDLLRPVIVDIEHVGSTSIPGCYAKPIIDIAIGVRDKYDMEKVKSLLLLAGYYHNENAGAEDRLFFAKGEAENRTHNIHVEIYGGISWRYHMDFRRILTNNPTEVKTYSDLKRELQRKFENNRTEYTKSKDNYIKDVLNRYSNEEVTKS